MTALAAAAAGKPATIVPIAVIGALLLLYVLFRTWRTGFTWFDTLAAVLLGVVIASAGDGLLSNLLLGLIGWIQSFIGFVAKAF
ncbi:hypothetical protein OOJ91_12440 [Micromonospora lupini]|uniref:hypothetical protein n=1 Tax=Micromonospora lupini TaxID=285679 RepID=UPI00225BEC00|nr:hypothetical protein [Micromonospora lupini]MCX5066688.1 hypothetical protein [Micromonospora lupini]